VYLIKNTSRKALSSLKVFRDKKKNKKKGPIKKIIPRGKTIYKIAIEKGLLLV